MVSGGLKHIQVRYVCEVDVDGSGTNERREFLDGNLNFAFGQAPNEVDTCHDQHE